MNNLQKSFFKNSNRVQSSPLELRHYPQYLELTVKFMFCALIQALSVSTDAYYFFQILYQFASVAQSCLTPCDPRDCSTPGFPVHHQLLEPSQSIKSVMPSNHLILCHFLLLLPSIFPSIKVFSNELAVCIRWPKYWSFSFSISPSNEYSGLISFRTDWLEN